MLLQDTKERKSEGSRKLTSLVQLLGKVVGKGRVTVHLITTGSTHGDEEAPEVS